jgi:hypothetical protein
LNNCFQVASTQCLTPDRQWQLNQLQRWSSPRNGWNRAGGTTSNTLMDIRLWINTIIAVCEIIDISKIYSLKKRLVERIKQQGITNEIMHGFGWLWNESLSIFEGLSEYILISRIYLLHEEV